MRAERARAPGHGGTERCSPRTASLGGSRTGRARLGTAAETVPSAAAPVAGRRLAADSAGCTCVSRWCWADFGSTRHRLVISGREINPYPVPSSCAAPHPQPATPSSGVKICARRGGARGSPARTGCRPRYPLSFQRFYSEPTAWLAWLPTHCGGANSGPPLPEQRNGLWLVFWRVTLGPGWAWLAWVGSGGRGRGRVIPSGRGRATLAWILHEAVQREAGAARAAAVQGAGCRRGRVASVQSPSAPLRHSWLVPLWARDMESSSSEISAARTLAARLLR